MEYVVLVSIVLLLGVLATGKVKAFYLFGGVLALYHFLGLISMESMLANFVNPALITLLFLLVVGQALQKTHWVEQLSSFLFVKSQSSTYLRMAGVIGLSSAFLNNTAVVATLMSNVRGNRWHASSKLLIPLSYFAIIGGTLTLVGTSTNLIVNSFVIQQGLPSLGVFDFLYIGLPLLIVGTLVIWLISSRLLPEIKTGDKTPKQYFVEAVISQDSSLTGKTIEEAGLRNLGQLYLAQIVRKGRLISPVSPREKLLSDDVLMFTGNIKDASKILHMEGLSLGGESLQTSAQHLIEVVLSHQSNLIGKTIKKSGFRSKFDAAVLAVHRGNKEVVENLSDLKLKAGDSLLLVAGNDFFKRDNLSQNFYFYSDVGHSKSLSNTQSTIVGVGFISVLVLSALSWVPLINGLFAFLMLLFAMRVLKFHEVKRSFPFELTVIIGSALGIASVMVETGVAKMIAENVLTLFSHWGLMGSLVGVFLFTLLLTELITNNASAAIGVPIAIATAHIMNADPMPFIMAVAYAASASFLTPYGYQTNLMVYAPGGYRFAHYIKAGLPVTIFYSLTVLVMIPWVFPFTQN